MLTPPSGRWEQKKEVPHLHYPVGEEFKKQYESGYFEEERDLMFV